MKDKIQHDHANRTLPLISVIVPVYNAAGTLTQCLSAIAHLDYPHYELIVVDDASSDRSAEIAALYADTLVCLTQNRGAAHAKNQGATRAQGDVFFFTDSDVILPADALQIVSENLRDPEVDGVVGLLAPTLPYEDFASQFKNLWMHFTYARLPRRVGLFYTSAASIRRRVFEQEAGFDEGYTGASVTEDMDFGQRLLTAGYRIVLDKRLQVQHLKRYRWTELLRTDLVRSRALMKIWLRNKIDGTGRKHFASVPWFFTASVPLSGLMALGLLLALLPGLRAGWGLGLGLCSYLLILILNMSFLHFLYRARGIKFLLQSSLFLPLNLFLSGLGIATAFLHILGGNRY